MIRHLVRAAPWLGVFGLAFGYRVYLIAKFPPMYWWDAFARIWESDHLVVRHWLPLPQVPVMLVQDPIALRCVYAFFGAAAAVTMGVAVTRIWSLRHGVTFALLLALMPVYVKWSVVPYQEPVMLAFLGVALAVFPRGLDEGEGWLPWVGAAALTAAAMCRYEPWLLAVLAAGFCALRREWRALRFLIPTAVFIALWIATSPMRDSMMGPERLGRAASAIGDLSLTELVGRMWDTTFVIGTKLRKLMTGYMMLLAGWGMIASVVKARRGDRELALFFLGLYGLTVARSVAVGSTTTRMLVFPCMVVALYAVIGWFDVWRRLQVAVARWLPERGVVRHAPLAACLIATAALTAPLLWSYHKKAYKTARNTARELMPELELARELGELPREIRVHIEPRRKRNILKESGAAAIFANNPSLDPHEPRWSYDGRPPNRPPDKTARYKKGRGYVIEDAAP